MKNLYSSDYCENCKNPKLYADKPCSVCNYNGSEYIRIQEKLKASKKSKNIEKLGLLLTFAVLILAIYLFSYIPNSPEQTVVQAIAVARENNNEDFLQPLFPNIAEKDLNLTHIAVWMYTKIPVYGEFIDIDKGTDTYRMAIKPKFSEDPVFITLKRRNNKWVITSYEYLNDDLEEDHTTKKPSYYEEPVIEEEKTGEVPAKQQQQQLKDAAHKRAVENIFE